MNIKNLIQKITSISPIFLILYSVLVGLLFVLFFIVLGFALSIPTDIGRYFTKIGILATAVFIMYFLYFTIPLWLISILENLRNNIVFKAEASSYIDRQPSSSKKMLLLGFLIMSVLFFLDIIFFVEKCNK